MTCRALFNSNRAIISRMKIPTKEELQANFALCDKEHDSGITKLAARPRVVTIETTRICNLKCVMCPHALDSDEKYEHFPAERVNDLKNIITTASIVQLHGLGEPFMNPAFWDILKLCHENQHVAVNTNGLLLKDKVIEKIVDSPISEINFSIDSATPATYHKIRGADFNQVKKAVGDLARARGNNRKLRIVMNMTLMHENIREVPLFVSLASELGADAVSFGHLNEIDPGREWIIRKDDFTFDYLAQQLGNQPELSDQMIKEAESIAREKKIDLLLDWAKPVYLAKSSEEKIDIDPIKNSAPDYEKPPSPKDCNAPWHWLFILTNGSVMPCCFGSKAIGDLRYRSADDIWNGSAIKKLRSELADDTLPELCMEGYCKFVNVQAKESRKRLSFKIRSNLEKNFHKISRTIKLMIKKLIGEKIWIRLRDAYRLIRRKF